MGHLSSVLQSLVGLFASATLYCFFILSSFAVSRARSLKVRELAHENFPGSKYARVILARAEHYLLSLQIGAFLSAVVIGIFSLETVRNLRSVFYSSSWIYRFVQHDEKYASLVFSVLVLIFISASTILFLQLCKALVLLAVEKFLCWVSLSVVTFGTLFEPLTRGLHAIVSFWASCFGVERPAEREFAASVEEINEIVETSSKAGVIEETEKNMIQGVFNFSETIVRQVMTPRSDIIWVHEDADLDEIAKVFSHEAVSRLVVCGENLDQLRGVLLAKDLMHYVGTARPTFELSRCMRPAYCVPNTQKIDDLLQDLRHKAVHFAVVLDEHGGVDGVVTIEDLIEEIVGDIFDEHDSPNEELGIRKTKSGDLLVAGSLPIDDLNRRLGMLFPSGAYDTIAGLVTHRLGRIPLVGEIVEVEGTRMRIEQLEQNRITVVRFINSKKPSQSTKLISESFETPEPSSESNQGEPKVA